jgi:hypothetical protein
MKCKMCELIKDRKQKIFYEDKNIIIIKNINKYNYNEKRLCIWKKHKKMINARELKIFVGRLIKIRKKLNKKGIWWDILLSLRSCPNHFHMHLAKLITRREHE